MANGRSDSLANRMMALSVALALFAAFSIALWGWVLFTALLENCRIASHREKNPWPATSERAHRRYDRSAVLIIDAPGIDTQNHPIGSESISDQSPRIQKAKPVQGVPFPWPPSSLN